MADISETVAGLRELADWLEQNRELVSSPNGHSNLTIGGLNLWLDTKEQLLAFKQASGATHLEKGAVSTFYWLARDFGGSVKLEANIPREQACERIVVGTREVEEQVIPASTEEVVEWVCHPLLAEKPVEA